MLLGIFLWHMGICMDVLDSLVSTINEYSNFLWNRMDDVCFVDLFFVMEFSIFHWRNIENFLVLVCNNGIFSSWSLLFSWVVLRLILWFLSSDSWSLYSVDHNFFDSWEEGEEFFRSGYFSFWKWESSSKGLFQDRKQCHNPFSNTSFGGVKHIGSDIYCWICSEIYENEKKFLFRISDISLSSSSVSPFTVLFRESCFYDKPSE